MKRKVRTARTKAKAIVLFSGGLDSIIAVKLLQEQEIDVIGVHFTAPFFCKPIEKEAEQLGIKLIEINLGEESFKEFMEIIRKPRFGYGSAINPCVDCHLFMLKKAKVLMKKLNADFIATGEVLNERPMSQTREKLGLIELESGLQGKLLRPLSAKLLPETLVEKQGLVNRDKLLAIQGRSRKLQIALAKKFNLSYPTPAGGCLLCEKEFAIKMRDLLRNKEKIESRDIELLKVGRHFRVGRSKIVVGRSLEENKKIISLSENGWLFEVKDFPSPITLLENPTKESINIAAGLTVFYSDAPKNKKIEVAYDIDGSGKFNKSMKIKSLKRMEIERYRIK